MTDQPKRVVTIVQARVGGTRFPGKVLEDVAGRTMLERHVERLKRVAYLDDLVVAIPDTKPNDALAELCERKGWTCFRGQEDDVLQRYARVAKKYEPDVVVRTTADCPLIDPGVVAGLIERYAEGWGDYVSIDCCTPDKRTLPHGLDAEVFTAELLYDADAQATDPFEREHVTEWIRRHQDRPYKLAHMDFDGYKDASPTHQRILREARLTVDWPEDLALVRAIYDFWVRETSFITTSDVVWLLDKVPEMMDLNRHRAEEHRQRLTQAFQPISVPECTALTDATKEAMK